MVSLYNTRVCDRVTEVSSLSATLADNVSRRKILQLFHYVPRLKNHTQLAPILFVLQLSAAVVRCKTNDSVVSII